MSIIPERRPGVFLKALGYMWSKDSWQACVVLLTFAGHWKSHPNNENNKIILVMLPVCDKAFGQQEGAQ